MNTSLVGTLLHIQVGLGVPSTKRVPLGEGFVLRMKAQLEGSRATNRPLEKEGVG